MVTVDGSDLLLLLTDAGVECGNAPAEDVSEGDFSASGFTCIGPTAAIYLLVADSNADTYWVQASMCRRAADRGDTATLVHGDNWVAVAMEEPQFDIDSRKVAEILGGSASPIEEYCETVGGLFADSVLSRLADAGIECALDSTDNSLLAEGLFAREILCYGTGFVVLVAVADTNEQFDPLKEQFCANLLAGDTTGAITDIAFGQMWLAATQSTGTPISIDQVATALDGQRETLDRFCT